jgi:hypothetical protein
VTADLVGTTFISKGVTSNTFKQFLDIPINAFDLTLPSQTSTLPSARTVPSAPKTASAAKLSTRQLPSAQKRRHHLHQHTHHQNEQTSKRKTKHQPASGTAASSQSPTYRGVGLKLENTQASEWRSACRVVVGEGNGDTTAIKGRIHQIKAEVENTVDDIEIDDEKTGARIVLRALEEPLRQIAENAGLEGSVVVNDVRKAKKGHGLNAARNEIVDLVAAGVIDPAMVTRSALQNAASIAKNILTTEAIVAEVPEKDGAGGGAGGGMPDMSGMM